MLSNLSNIEMLATMVLAIGALGTAAFGIVDGLKWTFLGTAGFNSIKTILGDELMEALHHAYGDSYEKLLKAQYADGRKNGELPRTLRQGIRIGFPGTEISMLVKGLPGVNPDLLGNASQKIKSGSDELTDKERGALARFELAVDTRIDAALAIAETRYIGMNRATASVISIGIAIITGNILSVDIITSVIIGIAAVPVAPMAKDLATAFQSAGKAMKPKA